MARASERARRRARRRGCVSCTGSVSLWADLPRRRIQPLLLLLSRVVTGLTLAHDDETYKLRRMQSLAAKR
eukprot:6272260-Prymnesium_polylepis.1